jgi:hypothetical protein
VSAVPAGLVTERATVGYRAVAAAFDALENGPRRRADLIRIMAAEGLAPTSAADLLRTAIRRGDLLVTSRDEQGRPTLALPIEVSA